MIHSIRGGWLEFIGDAVRPSAFTSSVGSLRVLAYFNP